MGFLNVKGGVLTYNEYKDKVTAYKRHGMNQFKSLYSAHKDRFIPLTELKWGEEMEYQIYKNDSSKHQIQLSSRGPELINLFNNSPLSLENDVILMPEFGSWMIEAVPSKPYNSIIDAAELLSCEEKLHSRRECLDKFFQQHNLSIASLPNVGSLGTPGHIDVENDELQQQIDQNINDLTPINEFSKSKFVVDKTINSHPRFSGLVKSIREHRGEKVNIQIPIYQDEKTNMTEATEEEPYPGMIYMDAMHFGMGQCCLQITYECQTINHASYLHDMLMPFTGIMAALSASGPIQKGKLSDYDMRWTVIEQSVDCRSAEERDPTNKEMYIPKSRYSSMNHYISNHEYVKDGHMDAEPIRFSDEYKQELTQDGVDDRLAEHIAKLFTRDPVPAYEGEFMEDHIDDDDITMHFENLQSTNWNSLRFKPPPSQDSKIGWRVEFRTMDIQITDFENTCLIVLTGLITNVINHFDVDFLIPITMSDKNMERAHFRDAAIGQKFWFNTNCINDVNTYTSSTLQETDYKKSSNAQNKKEAKYEELFIHEILCGKASSDFIGMNAMIRAFMEQQNYSSLHKEQIEQILEFLEARSKGEVPTGAKFIREYVLKHPLYKQDSIISPCLSKSIISQIMSLYKERERAPCDCEKDTGSNSCDSRCDQFIDMFENDYDFNDLHDNGEFFDQLSKKESVWISDNTQENDEAKQSGYYDGENEDIDYESPQPISPSKIFKEETFLNTAIVRMKDHKAKCQKLHAKQNELNNIYTQQEVRTMLLGQQWFQGRTGFNQGNTSSEEVSKEEIDEQEIGQQIIS